MKKRFMIASILALFLFSPGLSPLAGQAGDLESRLKKDPENREILLQLGRIFHNQGAENNSGEAVKKADQYLAKLLDLDPENALAMVYSGSVQTMKARDAGEPWEAMQHLEEGFARMDKAVLFAPDNTEIRLVRGINSLNIPDQFGRLPIALEDFEALEGLNPEKLSVLGERLLTEFHFSYGLALVRNGNKPKAILQFRRVLEIAPNFPRAEIARKKLALLEKDR